VAVLASCGGDGGLKAEGDDSGVWDSGEREREEEIKSWMQRGEGE
jgi:hypothetical protein